MVQKWRASDAGEKPGLGQDEAQGWPDPVVRLEDYSFSKDVKRKDFFLLDHDRHREKAFSTVPKTNEIHADIIRMTLEMGDNVLTVWQVGIPKVGGRNV